MNVTYLFTIDCMVTRTSVSHRCMRVHFYDLSHGILYTKFWQADIDFRRLTSPDIAQMVRAADCRCYSRNQQVTGSTPGVRKSSCVFCVSILPAGTNQLLLAGVVGVALTGFLLDSAGASAISGWWQAFAACAVQCLAGAVLFIWFAKGDRIFGSDTGS